MYEFLEVSFVEVLVELVEIEDFVLFELEDLVGVLEYLEVAYNEQLLKVHGFVVGPEKGLGALHSGIEHALKHLLVAAFLQNLEEKLHLLILRILLSRKHLLHLGLQLVLKSHIRDLIVLQQFDVLSKLDCILVDRQRVRILVLVDLVNLQTEIVGQFLKEKHPHLGQGVQQSVEKGLVDRDHFLVLGVPDFPQQVEIENGDVAFE